MCSGWWRSDIPPAPWNKVKMNMKNRLPCCAANICAKIETPDRFIIRCNIKAALMRQFEHLCEFVRIQLKRRCHASARNDQGVKRHDRKFVADGEAQLPFCNRLQTIQITKDTITHKRFCPISRIYRFISMHRLAPCNALFSKNRIALRGDQEIDEPVAQITHTIEYNGMIMLPIARQNLSPRWNSPDAGLNCHAVVHFPSGSQDAGQRPDRPQPTRPYRDGTDPCQVFYLYPRPTSGNCPD